MIRRHDLCILLLLLSLALPVAAEQPFPPDTPVLVDCKLLGQMARALVMLRDDGIPLPRLLATFLPLERPEIREILPELAGEVYAHPEWTRDTAQREIEARCLPSA
jgi:hypothetical protein